MPQGVCLWGNRETIAKNSNTQVIGIFWSVIASDTPGESVLAHVEVGRIHDIARVRQGFGARLKLLPTLRNDIVEFLLRHLW